MITVMRLGHRIERDKRLSTHVALSGRALGCDKMVYSGEKDARLEQSVRKVAENWGGDFEIVHERDWKHAISKFDGIKVHLTMYGMPFERKISEIRKKTKRRNLLIIVGGEKVPHEVYQQADYNLQVTGQPHSEVAALALFMHEIFQGKELERKFKGAKMKVIPQERGKLVKKKA